MNINTLHLVLESKWYNMISAGIKREEYRDIKPFWTKRIARFCSSCRINGYYKKCPIVNFTGNSNKSVCCKFNRVCFHRGYTSTTMTLSVIGVSIGQGKTEWGAEPSKKYYIIHLGDIITK